MLDIGSPPARRVATPHWLNARLGVGLLLVLVSAVVGARVVGSADQRQPVWAAAHRMAPGYVVSVGDFSVVRVQLGTAARDYVSASGPAPSGYEVTRAVTGGELVPADALRAPAHRPPDRRIVAVPVQPGHYPRTVSAGELVDIYCTVKTADSAQTRLAVAGVPVEQVPGGGGGVFGSSAGGAALEVSVPAVGADQLVAAIEQGGIDVVRGGDPARAAVTPVAPASAASGSPSSTPAPASATPQASVTP